MLHLPAFTVTYFTKYPLRRIEFTGPAGTYGPKRELGEQMADLPRYEAESMQSKLAHAGCVRAGASPAQEWRSLVVT